MKENSLKTHSQENSLNNLATNEATLFIKKKPISKETLISKNI